MPAGYNFAKRNKFKHLFLLVLMHTSFGQPDLEKFQNRLLQMFEMEKITQI
jgi:hypothetical protein